MTTYYVKTAGAGGNDGNSGLDWANAWATVQHAADTATAGDVVIFDSDTWDIGSQIDFDTNSGSSGNPITFQANVSGAAIWERDFNGSAIVFIDDEDYITFDGIVIDGDYSGGRTGSWAVRMDNANHITFTDCTIRDAQGWGIQARETCDYLTVEDSTIDLDYYGSGETYDGINTHDADNCTVDNCTIRDTDHCGINHRKGTDLSFTNNEVIDTSSHGIQLGDEAEPTAANTITGTIQGNSIHGQSDPTDNPDGIFIWGDEVGQVYIQQNDIYETEEDGIHIKATVTGPIYVYNNTLYSCVQKAVDDDSAEIYIWAPGTEQPTIVVKNNIVYHTYNGARSLTVTGTNIENNLDMDYNLWYSDHAAGEEMRRGGTTYASYNTYQGAGYEPNSVIDQDPDFVNAGAGNFNLNWGSPAIDAGVDVGLAFSGVAPDIGAHEYDQSGTTTSTSTSTTSTSTSTSTTSTSVSTSTTSTSISTSLTTSTSTSTTSTSVSTSTTSTSISTSLTTSTSTSVSTSLTTSTSISTTMTRLSVTALREVCSYEHDQILVPSQDATGYVYKAHNLLALLGMNKRVLRQARNWGLSPLHFIGQRGPYQDGETVLDMRLDPRIMQVMVAEPLARRMDFWDRRDEILDRLRPNRSFDGTVRPLVYRKWLPGGKLERGSDLVTTHGSAFVTSATGRFIERGLEPGMLFNITNGTDVGTDTVVDVPNDYTVELATASLATATDVGWEFRRGQSKRDLFCLLAAGPDFDEGPGAAPLYQTGYREALRFIAHDPCWYTAEELSETWTVEPASGNDLTFNNVRAWFPDRWLFGSAYVDDTVSIVYWGSAGARPQIEITGPASYPKIENDTTGAELVMDYEIESGEVVTIDCLDLTVENAAGENLLPYIGGDLATFTLEPAPQALNRSNDVTVTFASGVYPDSQAVIKWKNRYVGI